MVHLEIFISVMLIRILGCASDTTVTPTSKPNEPLIHLENPLDLAKFKVAMEKI